MTSTLADKTSFAIRSIVAALPVVGFWLVADIFQDDYWYAFFLTFSATLCWWIALFWWTPSASRYPHVHLFFGLYMLGYFVKFYILAYLVQNGETYWEYLDVYYRLERRVLEDYPSVTTYYETATLGLAFATFGLGALKVLDAKFREPRQLSLSVLEAGRIPKRALSAALIFAVSLFLLLLGVQASLGLNLVSGDERQVVVLPYRLAGIILATYKYVLVLLFVGLLWATDGVDKKLWRLTLASFVFYGIASGVYTTSKSYYVTVIIVVATLWMITNKLTLRRSVFLGCLVVLMFPFNAFLGVNRILRVLEADVGIVQLMTLAIDVVFDTQRSWQYVGVFHSDQTKSLAELLGPFMRMNGADGLLNMVDFRPTFSLDRVVYLLFQSDTAVNVEYATRVLGLPAEAGLAFSPSLMGYFYYVLGDAVLCGFALLAFFLFWSAIFYGLEKSSLRLRYVMIPVLLMSFIQYLSEGTLESMLMNIALILSIGIATEVCVRIVTFNGRRPGSSAPSVAAAATAGR